jgi:hypothetical protein
MFIFGGRGPHNTVYKDIYYLDLIEWIWVPVNPISRGPSGRFFFASECVGRKMVIQGIVTITELSHSLAYVEHRRLGWK